MRIQIQLFTLMRFRIQIPKIIRIRIRNTAPNNNTLNIHHQQTWRKVSNFKKAQLKKKVFKVGETMFTRALFPSYAPNFTFRDAPKNRNKAYKWSQTPVQWNSVADPDPNPDPPDPHVFGPPVSGSGSFYHHAKKIRKTLIPTILWLFLTFYLWKMM